MKTPLILRVSLQCFFLLDVPVHQRGHDEKIHVWTGLLFLILGVHTAHAIEVCAQEVIERVALSTEDNTQQTFRGCTR